MSSRSRRVCKPSSSGSSRSRSRACFSLFKRKPKRSPKPFNIQKYSKVQASVFSKYLAKEQGADVFSIVKQMMYPTNKEGLINLYDHIREKMQEFMVFYIRKLEVHLQLRYDHIEVSSALVDHYPRDFDTRFRNNNFNNLREIEIDDMRRGISFVQKPFNEIDKKRKELNKLSQKTYDNYVQFKEEFEQMCNSWLLGYKAYKARTRARKTLRRN